MSFCFPEPVQAPMIHWGNCLIKGIMGSVLPSAKKQFLQLINLPGTLTYLSLAKIPRKGIFWTHMTQLQWGRTGIFSNMMSSEQSQPPLLSGPPSQGKWKHRVRLIISTAKGEGEPSTLTLSISQSKKCGFGHVCRQVCACGNHTAHTFSFKGHGGFAVTGLHLSFQKALGF